MAHGRIFAVRIDLQRKMSGGDQRPACPAARFQGDGMIARSDFFAEDQKDITPPRNMSQEIRDDLLRSFPPPRPFLDYEDVPFFACLPELFRTIRKTLGIDVEFVRAGGKLPDLMARCFTVKVEGGRSPGCLVLLPPQDRNRSPLSPGAQDDFLAALGYLLGEAYRWQQTSRKLQEELTSFVPVPTNDANDAQHNGPVFNDTLFNILKESTKILHCHAASFYTLNPHNDSLRLRSCWGLPEERLLQPPRSLHDSLGDLEAILGQAVVLNNEFLFEAWGAPEDFSSAICVPVVSPMSVIGTLWFFSDQVRDFSDKDVRLMEIITGRIAAELERAALLRELHACRHAQIPA